MTVAATDRGESPAHGVGSAHRAVALVLAVLGLCSCGATTPGVEAARYAPPVRAFRCPNVYPALLPRPMVRRGTMLSPAVRRILVCRYAAASARASVLRLQRVRMLPRSAVPAFVSAVNRLPPFPGGDVSCPGAPGDDVLVLGAIALTRIEAVKAQLGGCREVANGSTVRWAVGGGSPAKRVLTALKEK